MNNLEHLYKLEYQKLKKVFIVKEYFDDGTKPMNVGIFLFFEKNNCLIKAVSDDDTIKITFRKSQKLNSNITRQKLFDISKSIIWKDCINKNLLWSWVLINQQGYEDGIQFCFSNQNGMQAIRQLTVIASELAFFTVN